MLSEHSFVSILSLCVDGEELFIFSATLSTRTHFQSGRSRRPNTPLRGSGLKTGSASCRAYSPTGVSSRRRYRKRSCASQHNRNDCSTSSASFRLAIRCWFERLSLACYTTGVSVRRSFGHNHCRCSRHSRLRKRTSRIAADRTSRRSTSVHGLPSPARISTKPHGATCRRKSSCSARRPRNRVRNWPSVWTCWSSTLHGYPAPHAPGRRASARTPRCA